MVIGENFNGHVGEGNTGEWEVLVRYGVRERNLERQMVVDFAKKGGDVLRRGSNIQLIQLISELYENLYTKEGERDLYLLT